MIGTYLANRKEKVDLYLESLFLDDIEIPDVLRESMRYSLLAGGKRIRPVLVMAVLDMLDFSYEKGLNIACAFELVHTYSLVHDDLPVMDDDNVRRGKLTNHKVFGEAIAVLAGDAMLTYAFEMISTPALNPGIEMDKLVRVINELSQVSGKVGMVGGQVIDIYSSGETLNIDRVWDMHKRKTGALIRGAVRVGGILGGANISQMERLSAYGSAIGLAFQVADDMLDVTGDALKAGKEMGKDEEMGKNTFPSVIGLEESKKIRDGLLLEANNVLASFGKSADVLKNIAKFIVERDA